MIRPGSYAARWRPCAGLPATRAVDMIPTGGYPSGMAHPVDLITTQALALDPAERLQLASRLIDSVEGPEDPGWASAWSAELDRRAAEVERGDVQCRSWEDVRADLQTRLKH